MILFRQRKGDGLDPGQTFPSFAGDVQVADCPDGKRQSSNRSSY